MNNEKEIHNCGACGGPNTVALETGLNKHNCSWCGSLETIEVTHTDNPVDTQKKREIPGQGPQLFATVLFMLRHPDRLPFNAHLAVNDADPRSLSRRMTNEQLLGLTNFLSTEMPLVLSDREIEAMSIKTLFEAIRTTYQGATGARFSRLEKERRGLRDSLYVGTRADRLLKRTKISQIEQEMMGNPTKAQYAESILHKFDDHLRGGDPNNQHFREANYLLCQFEYALSDIGAAYDIITGKKQRVPYHLV